MNTKLILFRHESPNSRITAIEGAVIEHCKNEQLPCLIVPHLYHLAESSELWKKLAKRAATAVFLSWLPPRPTAWLLRRHRIECEESRILDLNGLSSVQSVAKAISRIVENESADGGDDKRHRTGKKVSPNALDELHEEIGRRWYPVIDVSRCINCQHCFQFCLFGVYESDSQGKVEVRNPDLCKTGCPACARICPQSAIMFPLYEKDEAIAGAPGKFVVLDAAARKMYYSRMNQPCPVCGREAERDASAAPVGKKICPECGRPILTRKTAKEANQPAARLPFDDLDKLVDRFDQEIRRKSR